MSFVDGKYPFSDAEMFYDFSSHRYRLTTDCVRDRLGIDLNAIINPVFHINPSAAAEQWLIKQHNEIYIYLLAPSNNTTLWEMLLAKVPTARQWIKECLLLTVSNFLTNGFPSDFNGVNIVGGSQLDVMNLRQSVMQITGVEEVAARKLPELGMPMRYGGPMNNYVLLDYLKKQGGIY